MKKLLSLLLIALLLLSLVACAGSSEFEQDPVTLLQNDVIGTFGITVENEKIISYIGENNYIKYININYNDEGKVKETTHYFYNNDADFEEAKELYSSNAAAVIDSEKRHISFNTSEINTGSFNGDKDLLKSNGFTIKSV